MIEISDIKDRKSLEQWLTDWPKQNGLVGVESRTISVAIAHRAAMRVLPLWWQWTFTDRAHKRNLTPLPVLRANLITGVAAKMPTPVIREAAAFASAVFTVLTDTTLLTDTTDLTGSTVLIAPTAPTVFTDSAAYASASATATVTATIATATTAAAAADSAAAESAVAAADLWNVIRMDCASIADKGDVLSLPLWPDENSLVGVWQEVKTRATAPEWSFWINWYDDALAGHAPDWDMLEQIALIDPDIWEAGPKPVAKEIARIGNEFNSTPQTPQGRAAPEVTLAENAIVIRLQLDALKLFVEQEIRRLRGRNEIPDTVLARIDLLETIIKSVVTLQSVFIDGISPGENALVVIEENLPQVIKAAVDLAEQDESPEVSETIVMIGAIIEHLTKRGTPGILATGIAALEVAKTSVGTWFNKSKSSDD